MLTDAALKYLKPKDKIYKVTDRDGMYVLVKPSGTLTFRLDYRMNGRRETVTFGKYGPAGLSLARAPNGRSARDDRQQSKSSARSAGYWKRRALVSSARNGSPRRPWRTAHGRCAVRSSNVSCCPGGETGF